MPKFQQIKEIYFQAFHEHLARMDDRIYDAYIEGELQTIIRITNGTIILAETPEPFTIRGHGPKKISIDEMNFIRKDQDLWLSALLPMTLTQTVGINVASTPWNKDSVYYKMCYDKSFRIFSGNIHERDPPRYFLTYKDVQKPNGPLDPYQVEVMREQYAGDPWRWKREMESSFVDDETAFLPWIVGSDGKTQLKDVIIPRLDRISEFEALPTEDQVREEEKRMTKKVIDVPKDQP
jgi:hypothetical protein